MGAGRSWRIAPLPSPRSRGRRDYRRTLLLPVGCSSVDAKRMVMVSPSVPPPSAEVPLPQASIHGCFPFPPPEGEVPRRGGGGARLTQENVPLPGSAGTPPLRGEKESPPVSRRDPPAGPADRVLGLRPRARRSTRRRRSTERGRGRSSRPCADYRSWCQ